MAMFFFRISNIFATLVSFFTVERGGDAEELSAVFLKSRASVLVSLQGRHMGVETNTARGSIIDPWRIGQ